jgi:tryptophan-rich sensory protein
MTRKSWLSLVVFLLLVAITSGTGASFRPGSWYEALVRPDWTPPNWLFPPVWTVLYIMIAIAGWRVHQREGVGFVLGVWLAGLVLNGLWSVLMFGWHRIDLAAVDILAIWIAALLFIVLTWNRDRIASLLFVPYLAWLSYAAALNLTLLRLNPPA